MMRREARIRTKFPIDLGPWYKVKYKLTIVHKAEPRLIVPIDLQPPS
jgi:hypothetical protein